MAYLKIGLVANRVPVDLSAVLAKASGASNAVCRLV